MSWAGEFCFGESWAAYRGAAADNKLHAHAALQIVFGLTMPIEVRVEQLGSISGDGVMIRQGVAHAIISREAVGVIYLEQHSAMARALEAGCGQEPACRAPEDLVMRFRQHAHAPAWVDALDDATASVRPLHPRLAQALERATANPLLTVASLAREAGASPSNLRALAKNELGLPLSRWLLWRKLERATRAVAAGADLAQAAVAGGFADQAHYSRTMRRMFGITPASARAAL